MIVTGAGTALWRQGAAVPVTMLTAAQQSPGATVAATTTAVAPTTATPTTTKSKVTSTTSTPPTTATSPTTAPTSDRPSAAFCDTARSLVDALRRISVSLTDPDGLRSLMDLAVPRSAASADASPSAMRADTDGLRAMLASLRAALEAADYQLAKLPPEFVVKLQSPETLNLIVRFETSVAKSC
ncbi:MAG: hypothetical protein ACRD2W_05715 [Acidimicrobiales bacterium]